MKKIKCYHFCSNEFYNDLINKGMIIADNRINNKADSTKYGYDYVFNKMKINDGNGMFFSWVNYKYTGWGRDMIITKEENKYKLLELEVDDYILTDYNNWCSFCLDLEEKVPNAEDMYSTIYNLDDEEAIQVLLRKISVNDIVNVYNVDRKII